MQEDWMTSKSKKMGEMVKVTPYIEQGEYKKYLITHEQDVCETRQFGFYACQECGTIHEINISKMQVSE